MDVTTSSRRELEWLYGGVARFFPEAWKRFANGVTDGEQHEILAAYCRLMASSDDAIREHATREWCAWEDAVLSLEEYGKPNQYTARTTAARPAFVRICSHCFSNGARLDEEQLLRNADRLDGIPGVLIHGRNDMSAPPETAFRLAQRWSGAELHIIEHAGHKGNDEMQAIFAEAMRCIHISA